MQPYRRVGFIAVGIATACGPPHSGCKRRKGRAMIVLGLILLILGFILHISILWTIGIIVLIIGIVFLILGMMGRAVGGRKYWY
jgi:uncharacterized membrane protein HdeD (DUF308 family)